MATLNYFQTANMANPYAWQTTSVTNSSATSYTVTDNLGFSATFYGNFTYDAGVLSGGTVTGYDVNHNNALEYTVRDANLDALTVNGYITNKNAVGLQQYTLSGNDTITGTAGVDVLRGWGGNDTYIVDMMVKPPSGNNRYDYIDFQDTVIEAANGGTDTIKPSITSLLTSPAYLAHEAAQGNDYWIFKVPDGRPLASNVENMDASGVGIYHDTIEGNELDNVLTGNIDHNYILGYGGNDILIGHQDYDQLDGGTGIDTAVFNLNINDVTEVRHLKTGGANIRSAEGLDTVYNIETLQFLDSSMTAGVSGDVIRDWIATRALPSYTTNTSSTAPTLYTGPVAFLEYQHFGTNVSDSVLASRGNDFINLLGGDDAANGGLGDDVLDGGTGSNFLTGGGDNDTFYLDGRSGSNTWSTITDFVAAIDFHGGDAVNIWGWVPGTSKLLLTQENGGAEGFTGATFHYDLNNNGTIDTSITFTGLTLAQVPASQALSVAGNGYLLIA